MIHSRNLILLVLLISKCIQARPEGPNKARIQHTRDDPLECHRAEDYTTEWFLDHAKPEFSQPLVNTALFYSSGMSKAARRTAKANSMITIWDIWPCYLYNHLNHEDNPLRCIHHSDEERQMFFSHMSRAFAMKAQNFSRVLHSSANYRQPPDNGIWGSVEFPALQKGGLVDSIEKLNEDGTLSEVFWRRERKQLHAEHTIIQPVRELKRRSSNKNQEGPPMLPPTFHGTCMSPAQLSFFDNVDW